MVGVSEHEAFDVTIISGLSGAGRSAAADVLEDLGFFVIDNLPPALIPKVTELGRGREGTTRFALVVDTRAGEFLSELEAALAELRETGARTRVLFLEASDEVLVRRFETTRRRHPLTDSHRVTDGIARERELLEELRGQADVVVDTSELNVHELRDRLRELFGESAEAASGLQISVVSFGYKHGLPLDVDLVFDCRFLPNPHWVESLRPLPGTDPKVRRYVMKQHETQEFLEEIERLFALLLPAYVREGKSYLSIGVGCTGGHHRSVVLAAELAKLLERLGFAARVHHRDLDRE
jgi:RNase adapter protein RapZ